MTVSLRSRMEHEIYEQPARLRALLEQDAAAALAAHELERADVQWLLVAARGSSDNAARYAQYLFGVRHGLAVALAAPSVLTLYGRAPSLAGGALLGLSQSGQSPDIVACAKAAVKQGRPALIVTNDEGSPLAAAASRVLPICAGEERAVAATKTYTATLLGLAMLSSALGPAAQAELARVPEWVERTLALRAPLDAALQGLRDASKLLVVSRGFNYATAHELALKIKEISYVPAQAYSLADLLHGPVALVDSATAVVLIAASGAAARDSRTALSDLGRRGARVVVISDDAAFADGAHGFIPLPAGVPEWLSPITAGVAAQLVAHDLALALGHDPDNPRGLRKVTRTH